MNTISFKDIQRGYTTDNNKNNVEKIKYRNSYQKNTMSRSNSSEDSIEEDNHIVLVIDSDSNSDCDQSSRDSQQNIDIITPHIIKLQSEDYKSELTPTKLQLIINKLIHWFKSCGLLLYLIMINIGIPCIIYYFAFTEDTINIPYWLGYSVILLTNLFKLMEGIAAGIVYGHRKTTKRRRLLIDLETRHFNEVYETDLKLAGCNNNIVLVDGLPLVDDDSPLDDIFNDDKIKKHMTKITSEKPHLLVLVPAYLINEKDLIEDTLRHMGRVIYSGRVEIMLVFNTPSFPEKDELVERLHHLSRSYPDEFLGKHLHIFENPTSHSKAENVNFGLDLIQRGIIDQPDIIAMYDADHQPELWSWERAVYMFKSTDCDVLQGRCVIRNNTNFFAKMVAVEYELMYTLHQKGGGILRDYGIFGGSNGFWRYELLSEIKMDESMLTEDIDSNFRSLESGAKVLYCDDVISYELTPPSFTAWKSQRLRWSQGWFEVTFRHTGKILTCKKLTWQQRLMTLIYLPYREISVYLMAQIFPVFLIFLLKYSSDSIGWHMYLISILVKDVPIWINTLIVGVCNLTDAHRWYNPEYRQVNLFGYIQFIMFSPFYLQALLIISMISHYRHFVGKTKWIVTPR